MQNHYQLSDKLSEFLSFSKLLADALQYNFQKEVELKVIALHTLVSKQFSDEIINLTVAVEQQASFHL